MIYISVPKICKSRKLRCKKSWKFLGVGGGGGVYQGPSNLVPRVFVPLDQRSRKRETLGASISGVRRRCTGSSKKNNMADQTPKKTLTSHVCRCCNCSFQNNPIDLFGAKSESEQLIALLENVTGLDFVENDGFSRKLCKSRYNRVKQFAEFKLCARSHADQAKRGKKDLESPSVTEQRQQKRGKHDGHDDNERSRVRQCLQLQPAATQPKECREQLPESAARILPEFLQPKTAVEPSKGALILAKSCLRNTEVCNIVS